MSLAEKFAASKVTARKIWALTLPYFKSEEKWRARLMLGGIIALNLASVYMLVMYNEWFRLFYNALETRDQAEFWHQLLRFTVIAFALICIAVYKFYLTQLLQVRWRAWMTGHYVKRWLSNHAFYKLELARYTQSEVAGSTATPDNPDQRIQEDLQMFSTYTISLSMGLLNSVVTLISFVTVLWIASGAFEVVFGGVTYEIYGFMVWAAVAYCLVGSVLTHFIGRRQIPLNFQQQRYEADFRHHMVRVREYSESIAMVHGENVERRQVDMRFANVLRNYLELLKAKKRLLWFSSFFGQAAVVFPIIVSAPRVFSGAIKIGDLMQISQAFGQVQDSLSWFVDNYSSLAEWRATTDRLTSFEEHMALQEMAADAPVSAGAPALSAQGLSVVLPTGVTLLDNVSLSAQAGESVLLEGPSGSGKSTLFRAFAGIWPFARGQVAQPANAMFIPQRPYFPNGPLRDALAYPEPAEKYSDAQLDQALNEALLPHLAGHLNDQDAWSQKLSGGEQQRLAIARVLLKKPAWIFADEATSALDEPAEKDLYEKLLAQTRAAGGALVSIAHRPTAAAFHDRRWTLAKRAEGAGGALYTLG